MSQESTSHAVGAPLAPEMIPLRVAAYFATIRAMDVDAFVAMFAADGISHDPVGAPPHVGHAAIRQFAEGIFGLFETVGLTEDQVFVGGNGAAVKWTGRGRGKNGAAVTFEGVDVIELNDAGTIQLMRAYWDPAPVLAKITPGRVMDSTELNAFGSRYTTAWCSQDPASVAAFFAAGGSLSVNAGAPAVGREAIATVAQGFMTTFPDLELTMDGVEPQPQGAVFRWTLSGTNTGPGGTGHRVRISGYEVWTFGPDGLVAESEGHFDAAEYERQLDHGVSGR